MVGVFLFQERRHGVVPRRGIEDLGTQQCPRQQRPQQRDRQADTDQDRAPLPHHMLEHPGHRRVLQIGQLRLAHDPQGQHVHQHQQGQYAKKADNRSLAHIRALFCTPGIHAGPFNADKHEDRDQHHVAHLVHHAAQARRLCAPEIPGENIRLEGHRREHDKHHDRDDFGHGGQLVDKRRFLDPAQHQEMHAPQQQRCATYGDRRVALAKHREKIAQGAEQQYEVTDVAHPGADPVAPG